MEKLSAISSPNALGDRLDRLLSSPRSSTLSWQSSRQARGRTGRKVFSRRSKLFDGRTCSWRKLPRQSSLRSTPAGVAFGLLGDLASLLDADRIYDALLSAQRAPAPAPDEMEVEIPEVVEVTRLLQRCTTAAFKTGDAHAPIGVLAHICLRFSLLGPWPTGNLKDVTTNLSSALSRGKNERRPKSKSTKSKKKAVRRSGSPKR